MASRALDCWRGDRGRPETAYRRRKPWQRQGRERRSRPSVNHPARLRNETDKRSRPEPSQARRLLILML
ncbi:hypothetical protein G5B35_13715 [Parapusillimonas sp. SGNA-6]|nr:hypothetical protein [Parapusillimonas sp. SGNA-6]